MINTLTILLFLPKKGSDEERGIIAWKKQMVLKSDPVLSEQEESTYDFPIGMELLKK